MADIYVYGLFATPLSTGAVTFGRSDTYGFVLATDPTNFFYDHINHYFALGHSTPLATLHVEGTVLFNDAGLDRNVRMEGAADANLFFLDAGLNRLGFGTAAPQSKVDIEGNLAVGATYSGTTAAPANGAIIEGDVGIGVNNPGYKLEVSTTLACANLYGQAQSQNADDTLYLGDNTQANFFIDRQYAGGAVVIGYNTVREAGSVGGGTFQVFNNATDRILLFHCASRGATGAVNQVVINNGQEDVDFYWNTDVNTYGLMCDAVNANVTINGVSVSAHYDIGLVGDGVLMLTETTTPTADTNYGKVYNKNDNYLYFQDGAGSEHKIPQTAADVPIVDSGSYYTGTETETALQEVGAVFNTTTEPTGFVDRVATLSFNDGDNTFTITGDHDIYIYGIRTTKTTDSIEITEDTTGLYWIYYNAAGVLTQSTVGPGFGVPTIATVYWNTTTNKGLLGEERHGIKMDVDTHTLLHYTVGTRYESGLTGTFGNTTFTITDGVIDDEDLAISIAEQTTCNVLYKDGSAEFKWLETQTKYYYEDVGSNINYNNGNVLTPLGGNQYVAYWIFATNDATTPIVSLMGQRTDTNIANARDNNTYESLELGTLPFQEMKLLYRVILRNTATPYIETLDLRSVSNLPAGTYLASDHGVLTGLTDDDHAQYLLADGTRALAGAWDMGSQILTNANIDSGDINVAVTNTEWDAAYSHVSNDGSDHSFINQNVTTTGTPTFGITTLGDSSQLATSAAPTADADIANKKYVDDSGGATSPGGNDTELQYNNGGAFGGLSVLTWDDTDFLLGTGGTTKLQFRDAAIYIQSATDGHLDLTADTSIDLNSDVVVSGDLTVADAKDIAFTSGAKIERDANGNLLLTPEAGLDVLLAQSSMCRVTTSGHLNLVSGTITKVQLDTETFDIGSNFDIGNYRYTAPVTGYYQVNSMVTLYNVIGLKRYDSFITVNGSPNYYSASGGAHSGLATQFSVPCSGLVYAVAGQYIELYIRSNAGVNTVDVLGNALYTYMDIHLVAVAP